MAKVFFTGQINVNILDSIRMIRKKDTGFSNGIALYNSLGVMEENIEAIGKMVSNTGKGNFLTLRI